MTKFEERRDRTKQYMLNKDVTPVEAMIHGYYWIRLELAINRRRRAQREAERMLKKLNDNLAVLNLRKDLMEL